MRRWNRQRSYPSRTETIDAESGETSYELESRRFDETGLVPHSEAWFSFYEDQLFRLTAGEPIPYVPLAVIDRVVEAADRELESCGAI